MTEFDRNSGMRENTAKERKLDPKQSYEIIIIITIFVVVAVAVVVVYPIHLGTSELLHLPTLHRMISENIIRLGRRPYCKRTYYFCWALPFLRFCLTTNTGNSSGQHQYYFNSGVLLCDAFSSTAQHTSRNLVREGSFRPAEIEFEPSTLSRLSKTPNAPILMSRRTSPRSSRRNLSSSASKDILPESDDLNSPAPPATESPTQKRKNETKSISNDWSSLKVAELKEELKKRGLQTTGKKADLVALLEKDDRGTSESVATVPAATKSPTKKRAKTSATRVPASPSKKTTVKQPTSPRKAADHQRITEIDKLPKLWNDDMAKKNGSYTFKIASWNVAGLRALVRKAPNELANLCQKHNLDMLCLQETKLQEIHLEDPKLKLKGIMDEAGYDEHWSCSTAKKGYSGTCVFVRRRGKATTDSKEKQTTMDSFFGSKKKSVAKTKKEKTNDSDDALPVSPETLMPTKVGFSVGKEIDNEGRVVVMEFPWATIANVYVPNSWQKLERLDYRTKEWDKFFLEFMQEKQKTRGVPVIWLGDLNIAHRAYDIWNDGAKHLAKQAGVTEQERVSFTEQLEAGYVDVFRRLHPDAKGNYSYWSQRAGNREPNKGLRLDYFVASEDMFHEDANVIPRDSYMIMDQMGSDHAPVVLELEIKGSA